MDDFNLPSAERVIILQELQNVMGGAPPAFWAACQICDLSALAELVKIAREYPRVARNISTITVQMVIHWTQSSIRSASRPSSRTPSHSNTPQKQSTIDSGSPSIGSPFAKTQNPPTEDSHSTGSPQAKRQKIMSSPGIVRATSLSRSQKTRDLAKQRDNLQCVLTGQGIIEVAHIYPFYSLKSREEDICGPRHIFWDHIHCFWPKEKVTSWQADLFPNGIDETGVERIDNLITLSADVHRAWNQGAFALKPIAMNEDNTSLKIQFFWQKKQTFSQAAMNLLTTPFSTEHLTRNEGTFDRPIDFSYDGLRIKSGDMFELKTDDPIEKPLPNIRILELQWFLTRVAGMAGAAAPYDDEDFGDEDSEYAAAMNEASREGEISEYDISDLGLGEIEDDSFALSDSALKRSPPLTSPDSLFTNQDTKDHNEIETGFEIEDTDRRPEVM